MRKRLLLLLLTLQDLNVWNTCLTGIKRLPYQVKNSANGILDSVFQNLIKFLATVTLKFISWNMENTLIFFAEKKCE